MWGNENWEVLESWFMGTEIVIVYQGEINCELHGKFVKLLKCMVE